MAVATIKYDNIFEWPDITSCKESPPHVSHTTETRYFCEVLEREPDCAAECWVAVLTFNATPV